MGKELAPPFDKQTEKSLQSGGTTVRTVRKFTLFSLEEYAIISVAGCRGTVSHALSERGWCL